jgi:hypothetical protein
LRSAKPASAIEIAPGFHFRRQPGVGQQGLGERGQAGFASDLCLAAPFRLVGQVKVFEALLGVGGVDAGGQFGRQLALFLDRGEDAAAPVFHFAQVGQALVEQAQLDVVKAAGHLLAVAGDERYGCPFVEQAGGSEHLLRAAADLLGDFLGNGARGFWCGRWRHRCRLAEKERELCRIGRQNSSRLVHRWPEVGGK